MLQSRGFPKTGILFVSFRNEPLGVRGINEAIKSIVARAFTTRAKEWHTKYLRDAFMNGLEKAKIPTELKDAFVGHQRAGARKEYGIAEDTITTLYTEAFKFLTINGHGQTSRKVDELDTKLRQNDTVLQAMSTTLNSIVQTQAKSVTALNELGTDLKDVISSLLEIARQNPTANIEPTIQKLTTIKNKKRQITQTLNTEQTP